MPLEINSQMPSLEGATEWLNATGARAEAEARGQPVLVHFWSVNCAACKVNFSRVAGWRDGAEGRLCVIAVHTPSAPEEEDAEAVRGCVASCDLTEPCAIDNQRRLSAAFGHEPQRAPAYCLFDAGGKLRAYAEGAGGPDEIARALEQGLAAGGSSA